MADKVIEPKTTEEDTVTVNYTSRYESSVTYTQTIPKAHANTGSRFPKLLKPPV